MSFGTYVDAQQPLESDLSQVKLAAQPLDLKSREQRTLVIFESPKRIQKTFRDLFNTFGNRQVTIARELTKMHEEVLRGNLEDFANQDRSWKGEITLVIAGSNEQKTKNKCR